MNISSRDLRYVIQVRGSSLELWTMEWLSVLIEEMLKLVPKVSFISISYLPHQIHTMQQKTNRTCNYSNTVTHTEDNELEIDKNT